MLVLLRTPEAILDWCANYLIILFLGSIGLGFYNILSGVLRGMGDAVSALIYLSRSQAHPIGNQDMIYWSLLIAWGIGAIMSIIFYRFGNWRKKGITS